MNNTNKIVLPSVQLVGPPDACSAPTPKYLTAPDIRQSHPEKSIRRRQRGNKYIKDDIHDKYIKQQQIKLHQRRAGCDSRWAEDYADDYDLVASGNESSSDDTIEGAGVDRKTVAGPHDEKLVRNKAVTVRAEEHKNAIPSVKPILCDYEIRSKQNVDDLGVFTEQLQKIVASIMAYEKTN